MVYNETSSKDGPGPIKPGERRDTMKISINKEAITLAQAEDAREFARNESEWIDKEVIEMCVNAILRTVNDTPVHIDHMISYGRLEVTIDHYEMCVYASDVVANCWLDHGPEIDVLAFNVNRVIAGATESFLQRFPRSFSGVTV